MWERSVLPPTEEHAVLRRSRVHVKTLTGGRSREFRGLLRGQSWDLMILSPCFALFIFTLVTILRSSDIDGNMNPFQHVMKSGDQAPPPCSGPALQSLSVEPTQPTSFNAPVPPPSASLRDGGEYDPQPSTGSMHSAPTPALGGSSDLLPGGASGPLSGSLMGQAHLDAFFSRRQGRNEGEGPGFSASRGPFYSIPAGARYNPMFTGDELNRPQGAGMPNGSIFPGEPDNDLLPPPGVPPRFGGPNFNYYC